MPTSVWTVLAATVLLGVVVAALGSRLRRLPVSEPLLALLVGVALGPQVAGWLVVPTAVADPALLEELAAPLLVVSVMAIALRYAAGTARRRWAPVTLLLAVVMPLMALASTGIAVAAGTAASLALVLGCCLCPTDPVLSSSVVTGGPAERDLPSRTRQLLSLESGANDGLALPLVLVALAVAAAPTGSETALAVLREVGGAVLLGLAAGFGAAYAVRAGERFGSADGASVVLFTVVLALGVLGAARLLGVSAVIASFVAGLALNALETHGDRTREVQVDEALNRYAVLPFFLVLGAALPWAAWGRQGWALAAVVVGVLVLRRLPWLLALARPLRLRRRDAVFLGWFGPIGVSAVFYLADAAARLPAAEATELVALGTAVVAASTVVHGLTSAPGRTAYAAARDRDAPAPGERGA
ncbi:cation:proton antiporter [Nocardioides perillae]|uniref:NhaP-type Na+/H+ or K+/H+ antiporter n=1 Tax=Nocardioides perillae TaxID=1119534 RepID=A0A7Y9UL42_9ACTN|nr:NhaP-type Na+/H+ or K+/H+ antiporter [Nocardioides perillae]